MVAARYGVVVRTLDRWLDRPELNFPQPDVVNSRRYWWLNRLREWDRARIRQTIWETWKPARPGAPSPGAGSGSPLGRQQTAGAPVGKAAGRSQRSKTVLDKTRANGSLATSQATTETSTPTIAGRRLAHGKFTAPQRAALAAALELGELQVDRFTQTPAARLTRADRSYARKARMRPQLSDVRLFTIIARSAISNAAPQQNRSRHYQRPPGAL